MAHGNRMHVFVVTALFVLFTGSSYAQEETPEEIKRLAEAVAIDFVKDKLPAEIELYYLDNTDNDDQSMAIRYNWNATHNWTDDFGDSGLDFSGSRSNFFARGNYAFKDDVNPSELSEIGADWTRRWFPISVSNPLTAEQGVQVQKCLQASEDFSVTSELCREQLGFGATQMSYWYVDFDVHAKVEGDQRFDQRAYAYGFETNLSRDFGTQTWFTHPILTVGVEQVDPKGNLARDAVLATDEIYTRAYGELGFTGILGKINDQNIKLNFSFRYFQELSPEVAIKTAGLDTFQYTVIALQIPAAAIPGFKNPRNSFVLSFADGKLPYNVTSETTIELGFRHDIDFSEFF